MDGKNEQRQNTSHSSGIGAVPLFPNLLISVERQKEEGKGQMGKDRAKQTEKQGQQHIESGGRGSN